MRMLHDLVEETVNAPGAAATMTLGGPTTGSKPFISPSTFSDGDLAFYEITDNGTLWETGIGPVAAGPPATLTRGTVLSNSAGTTARINFTGPCLVFSWLPAARTIYRQQDGSLNAGGDALGGAIWAGTAGGTANAITINPNVPLEGNAAGAVVKFVATATNTGGATLKVGDLDALPLIRQSNALLRAGDIVSGQLISAICDGYSWRLAHAIHREVGELVPYTGGDLPPGCLWPDGRNVLRADYPALNARYAADGYPHGPGNGTTTFTLPDRRGRISVPRDNMGGTSAGRLANSIGNANAATLNFAGGDDRPPATTLTVADPGHAHPVSDPTHAGHKYDKVVPANANLLAGPNPVNVIGGIDSNAETSAAPTNIAVVGAVTGIAVSSSATGTGQNMPPFAIDNYVLFAGGGR